MSVGSRVRFVVKQKHRMAVARVVVAILFVLSITSSSAYGRQTTETRIKREGYPVEVHKIQTADGYILQMFRIPHSAGKKPPTAELEKRPIALVQHGLLSSSDCWILNGRDNALAYLLADAGYDVWLGNFRGNTYSRKHAKYSPRFQHFWNFEWHDMALYDLPAMIDYILLKRNQNSLHYVGHSQGTTTLFVLLSMIPRYNKKIKSAHLIAPIAYMPNMQSPLARGLAPLMGRPNGLVEVLGSAEFLPNNYVMGLLGAQLCKDTSAVQDVCSNAIFLICGFSSANMNYTLLPEIMKTHPAGSSVNQIGHYLQEYRSTYFRHFDYGWIRNKHEYKQISPPKYIVSNIKAETYLYYSENDWLAHTIDVHRLLGELPNVKLALLVPDKSWNHLDFLWGLKVRELIYDRVISEMNAIEESNNITTSNALS